MNEYKIIVISTNETNSVSLQHLLHFNSNFMDIRFSEIRMAAKTKQSGPVLDADIVFPMMEKFQHKRQLPTIKSVIGVLRHLSDKKVAHNSAIKEVVKLVYSKWYHDSVYCFTFRFMERKLTEMWKDFREGKKRVGRGDSSKVVSKYKELVENADKLWDVYATDDAMRMNCRTEWGVTMSENEHRYYEDQKGPRLMECDKGVDPVWYAAMMRKQRKRELQEEYTQERDGQFAFKDLDTITNMLTDHGVVVTDTDTSIETPVKQQAAQSSSEPSKEAKKRRLFVDTPEVGNDSLPGKFCHVRDSERKVKDSLYLTLSSLVGKGLSIAEASDAVVVVGNGMFERKWKGNCDNVELLDIDTLPDRSAIRDKLNLIEAESLAFVVDEIRAGAESGRMITAAIDSTTKKRAGQFATQGIHIGQNVPFPLPLMNICGETTEDIAMQVDFGFEILAAVKKEPVEDIYKLVDTHMTDSTSHNKGFAALLAELYNLDEPAGQLFCGSHTTLGFSSAMNKVVKMIETDMKVETILSKFMVGMELESKHGSLAGQALDMMLKLVAPEYSHKQWNYYQLYTNFLEQKGVDMVLFSYKDQRFGCLSRAAGVLLFNMEWLAMFLDQNPQISNRLACLVRELLELPYLKVVFLVFAVLGLQVVEPFYCKTIDKFATHSKLKEFYRNLHTGMSREVDENFFNLSKPAFDCVSDDLFAGVRKSYGDSVAKAISETASEHKDDAVKLVNLILPEMKEVLARQRRDYGLSADFPAEYPVFDQATNIDDTPVHNLAMERQCGLVDYRLKKLQTLQAVSRSMILGKAEDLRQGKVSKFRTFKKEVEAKRMLELQWQEKMKAKFATGADEKQIVAQAKERKRLDMLEKLKDLGGPFTDADMVRDFLGLPDIPDKFKQKRLKLEVQFARESSTTLPSVDPIFKIQVTLPTKKRRDKTAEEFAISLMAYLGKKAEKASMEYNIFKTSLEKYLNSDSNNND